MLKNVEKKFGTHQVLNNVNFTFHTGKIYGLLGRNGAGKTTLFNCINEDIKKDGGEIYLRDGEVREEIMSENIGYVLAVPRVPEFLTAREFVKFFIDINKDNIHNKKSVDEYLDFMKISILDRDKLLKDFSLGMQNKMQMLAYFILNPKILLFDEPLTSFDVVVAEEMKENLKHLKEDHIIIFSTHIMELAMDLCDEIVVLSKGILQKTEKDATNSKNFKKKIMDALMEE